MNFLNRLRIRFNNYDFIQKKKLLIVIVRGMHTILPR
jgi:hypothetical protein